MKLYSLFFPLFFLSIHTFLSFSKAIDSIASAKINSKVAYTIIVHKYATLDNGNGDFVKIQDAINSVPSGNQNWVRIKVYPGIYKEKVTIPEDKEYIILEGSGYTNTIITFDEHDQTDHSATFTSMPNNFIAKDITFKNSYEQTVAVAARISGDKSSFYRCGFEGFQDTLWDVQGRHYFKSCYIQGAIDFIWGGGQSIFEDCSINVTADLLPARVSAGYITAQKRLSSDDPSGFVFRNCSVRGSGHAYLGRAYGPYSRVIFWDTTLDELVVPAGWDAWSYRGHEENFIYTEVGCQGLGADTTGRVGWERTNLGDADVQEFSRERFLNQDLWIDNQPS